MSVYIPSKGDVVAVSLDPQTGHEQRGRRPALVISNDLFNRHTGLSILCPITSTQRNIPFHVSLATAMSVTGFVMVEQVMSIDWRARRVSFIETIDTPTLHKVLSIFDSCTY